MNNDHIVDKWTHMTGGMPYRVHKLLETYPTAQRLKEWWDNRLHWTGGETGSDWGFAYDVAHNLFQKSGENPVSHLLGLMRRWQDPEPGPEDIYHLQSYYEMALAICHLDPGLSNAYVANSKVNHLVLRALSNGLQTGTQPVCLLDGSLSDAVRFFAFELEFELFAQKVPFFAVLPAQAQDILAENLLVYPGTYPHDAYGPPAAAIPVALLLRDVKQPSLEELARIFRYEGAIGGYAWGNTRGKDGNYGAETLTHLVLSGLARHTGKDRPNQLGGSWPEIELTHLGMCALIKSGILLQQQLIAPRPTGMARGPWGTVEFDAQTGAVLAPPHWADEDFDYVTAPVYIDIEELKSTYPDEEIANRTYDLNDLGFRTVEGRHTEPDQDWREEFREGDSPRLTM